MTDSAPSRPDRQGNSGPRPRSGTGCEIESLPDLEARLAEHGSLAECYVQSLDLTGHSQALRQTDVTRAVFLGCSFEPGVEAVLELSLIHI